MADWTLSHLTGVDGIYDDLLRLEDALRAPRITAYTAAVLGDASAEVNKRKYVTMQVWDSTNERVLYATGSGTTDPWNTALGATAITPS